MNKTTLFRTKTYCIEEAAGLYRQEIITGDVIKRLCRLTGHDLESFDSKDRSKGNYLFCKT